MGWGSVVGYQQLSVCRGVGPVDIIAEHRLIESKLESFNPQMNMEQMNKCLISLRENCTHIEASGPVEWEAMALSYSFEPPLSPSPSPTILLTHLLCVTVTCCRQ